MRRLLLGLVVLILLGGYYLVSSGQAHKLLYYSVCDTPIAYRIDRVDPEFKLSEEDFRKNVSQAATIWGQAYGKPLFVHDPEAKLTVSLVYDKRQLLNDQIGELDGDLKAKENSLEERIADYESRVVDFKKRLSTLNSQVDFWNNQGGAPPEEYSKLLDQQEALQSEARNLNTLASQLNLSTNQYNAVVGKLNRTIGDLKLELQYRPEEGIYDPKENAIVIYFNITPEELIHTLAHEFGHARGLDHSEDPGAMMFFRTNRQLTLSSEDLDALKYVCREKTIVELLQTRLAESRTKTD